MPNDNMIVYCTEGNVIFDSNGNHKEVEKRSKGFKIKKTIVHPIFEKMREFNKDSFWDMFLLKASRDNFPKGFSFNEDRLYYSMKSKYNFEIRLDKDKEDASFAEMRDFVSNKGILSDKDKDDMKLKQIEDFDDSEELPLDSWKLLGKLQMNAIFTYITTLVQKYELSTSECKNLESMIRIGISSGYLNNKNIIVENSFIKEIVPLLWDEETRTFNIDTKNTRIKKIKGSKSENVDLSTDNTTTCLDFNKKYNISNINKKWEKFLKVVYKKR